MTISSTAIAQPAEINSDPVLPPGLIGVSAGTGSFLAVAEARADAPGYTFYRPQVLPKEKLPLVLWGNGGCRDNGLSASHFLREVASHGYFVIANGAPRKEKPVVAQVDAPASGEPPPRRPTPDETQVSQLLGGIAWAERATTMSANEYYNHIDTTRIAVMGHSCGGLQALAAGADPRISAVVVFNSGVYIRDGNGLSGVHITKDDLKKIHTPVAYVLGGPTDIAYANGMDDVARISHVPVFAANLAVGHGGTFQLENGGDWARLGVAWLDWQLKKDAKAARWFVGKDCGLCTNADWKITRKQFPETP
jgi:hypothetical protein